MSLHRERGRWPGMHGWGVERYFVGLWRNADFRSLWLAQTISEFGSRITREGLPLMAVLTLSASPAQMGILAALDGIPVLLVGLLAGAWVDRRRRRPVLIATDLGRALLLATIPLAALLGWLSLEHVYVVATLAGVLTVFFSVAHHSYVPTLVRREHVLEANSKLETTSSIAEIGGPALAGVLVQALTAPIAILFDALSFVLSAFSLSFIRFDEASPTVKRGVSLWHDVRQGLGFVLANPLLRASAGSLASFSFFGSSIGALYALYVVRDLGLSPATLGMLIAAGGVGALPGALLAPAVARRFGLGRTLIVSRLLVGLMALLIPLAAVLAAARVGILLLGQLLGDCALSIFFINEISLRQTCAPDHLLGRTNASMDFLAGGLAPIGALLGGVLGSLLGTRPTLLVAAMGIFLGVGWLVFSPVRRLRDLPSTETAPE